MRKMLAVLRREYFSAVRKKMFVFMTLFFPVLMAALFVLPGLLMSRALGDKRVAVIDATGALRTSFDRSMPPVVTDPRKALTTGRRSRDLPQTLAVEYVDAHDRDPKTASAPYLIRLGLDRSATGKLDAVLMIPADAFASPDAVMTFYSRAATDLFTQERLGSVANRAIQRQRLTSNGIAPGAVQALTQQVPVQSVQLSRTGEQKKGGEANFIVAFIFGALLIIPSFVYGTEIMRGIIQEKTDRVVEILISSMTPRQLLTGKVTGVALVGLTQITVWLLIGVVIATFGAATAMTAGVNVMQFLRPMVFVYFVIFFLLAYMTYVCVYAVAGAVCNTDKEAQQLIAPISMVMMLPWFMMVAIITNPDSSIAVGFSLAPVFGPITMFVRTLVSEPPLIHIVISILVSLATIAVFFWATAKIFRVGILSYGKRPTIPELWRWIKVA